MTHLVSLLGECMSLLDNGKTQSLSQIDLFFFSVYTSELFYILENNLIGYDDDSTLMAVLPSPGVRVTVAE